MELAIAIPVIVAVVAVFLATLAYQRRIRHRGADPSSGGAVLTEGERNVRSGLQATARHEGWNGPSDSGGGGGGGD